MSTKQFISSQQLIDDSFRLAQKIYQSQTAPDALIALWRGGSVVGMAVQEYLRYRGWNPYHTIIKTETYQGIEQRGTVKVENIDFLLTKLKQDSRVLLVDDIFDTGLTMKTVIDLLKPVTSNIQIATIFYKPARNLTELTPDYYLVETKQWLVLPHELLGLSAAEIEQKNPFLTQLLVRTN